MTILDSPVPHKFCASLDTAEQEALSEAADTGGVLLRVKSLRIEPDCLVITGKVPTTALAVHHLSDFPESAHPRSIGTMRVTWRSLLQPIPDEEIGYVVLQTPVHVTDQVPESEDGDYSWVSVSITRSHQTLKPGCIGAACCARCNRPIPPQRLVAVPNTRMCTDCQRRKENP